MPQLMISYWQSDMTWQARTVKMINNCLCVWLNILSRRKYAQHIITLLLHQFYVTIENGTSEHPGIAPLHCCSGAVYCRNSASNPPPTELLYQFDNRWLCQFKVMKGSTETLLLECRMDVSADGMAERDWRVWKKCRDQGVPVVMLLSGGYARGNAQIVAKSLARILESEKDKST